ncbi:Hsp33 family molecular chaperone HslO, partial [Blautia sp. DFI.9.9]|nr:Hsp33 family molecular chaperone HslO [Blautia sp. DFI.9.9]
MAKSEQIPSAVGLSVFVEKDDSIKAAGGFMVQVMPGASDEAITKLETAIQGMPRVSDLLLEGKTPEDILHLLFPDEELKMLQTMPVSYVCHCNK